MSEKTKPVKANKSRTSKGNSLKQKQKKFQKTLTMKDTPIPTRKVHKVKTDYNRARLKAELKQEVEELKE